MRTALVVALLFPITWDSGSNCPIGSRSARMPLWYTGPDTDMEFCEGAPIFAVEVRSKEDYGPAAERAMQEKRADYFACGTQVVWDVDLQSESVIKSYKVSDPKNPVVFRRGEMAHAEPAFQGGAWQWMSCLVKVQSA